MDNRPSKWHVIYYENIKGQSEVFDFVENVTLREKAKILAVLDILEERGPQLPRPYADFLEDGIHELRIKLHGNQVRILYFFCYRDFIILTNVCVKTTAKVPVPEINKSKMCRVDYLARNTEQSLRRTTNENT
jgi:hypothetical protein